jgi:hypothetical protein
MIIIRFFKAFYEWLFVAHGYLPFRQLNGGTKEQQKARLRVIHTMETMLHGHAKHQICKVCKQGFWAVKKNDTCRNIRCFFSYRLAGGKI